ncbi:MAG: SCO family protein [Flavobacteriales bacterium]
MKAHSLKIIGLGAIVLVLFSCNNSTGTNSTGEKKQLPFFGEFDVDALTLPDGSEQLDTLYYPIPKFSFINQDSTYITQADYAGYITLVDFFFTECPTICPMMSAQMVRLQDKFKKEHPDAPVRFLSFSVKPESDTPEKLRAYADKIGANLNHWNFLTGKPSDIYDLAQHGFLLTAFPSDTAQGGIFHTDKVTLLDRQLRMRGYYDGTSTPSMNSLYEDALFLSTQPTP